MAAAEGVQSIQIDASGLADDLRQLRTELSRLARTPAEDAALVSVTKAETAAWEKNVPKAVDYLRHATGWALQVAAKIGTTVASAALKHALDLDSH
jgi:hypothetical protein